MAGVIPRLVVRDTHGWGESQAGDIRFYILRYLSPRLVLRDTRGWGEFQAGSLGSGFSEARLWDPLSKAGYCLLGGVPMGFQEKGPGGPRP